MKAPPVPSQGPAWDIRAYEYKSGSPASACDINRDGTVNVSDVQLEVNMALGATPCTADLGHGRCDVVVVQRIVNAALGGACIVGP